MLASFGGPPLFQPLVRPLSGDPLGSHASAGAAAIRHPSCRTVRLPRRTVRVARVMVVRVVLARLFSSCSPSRHSSGSVPRQHCSLCRPGRRLPPAATCSPGPEGEGRPWGVARGSLARSGAPKLMGQGSCPNLALPTAPATAPPTGATCGSSDLCRVTSCPPPHSRRHPRACAAKGARHVASATARSGPAGGRALRSLLAPASSFSSCGRHSMRRSVLSGHRASRSASSG